MIIWMFPKIGANPQPIHVWDSPWNTVNHPSMSHGRQAVDRSWHVQVQLLPAVSAAGPPRVVTVGPDTYQAKVGERSRVGPRMTCWSCCNDREKHLEIHLESTADILVYTCVHMFNNKPKWCKDFWMVNPRSLDFPSSDPVNQQTEKKTVTAN